MTKIVKGLYKGTMLSNMSTAPTYDEMVMLIRLTGLRDSACFFLKIEAGSPGKAG